MPERGRLVIKEVVLSRYFVLNSLVLRVAEIKKAEVKNKPSHSVGYLSFPLIKQSEKESWGKLK